MAISHFQRAEYLLEKIVPVTDTRLDTRFNFYRAGSLSGEVGGQFPFEMYPVNCPGIVFVRTVSVRSSGRQYEILIGFYRIFLFPDTEPSGSLYTIDKDKLTDRLRTFPEMVQSFRIITDIRNMQDRGKCILFHLLYD